MRAHADDLRAEVAHIPGGDALADALMLDHREAALSPANRAMLDFAEKLTLRQGEMTRGDTDTLREHGFDDAAILHIVQVTALFNYFTRIADGLGIDHEPEWSESDNPAA